MSRRTIFISVAVLILVLVGGFYAFAQLQSNGNEDRHQPTSQLTGLEVDTEIAERPILAVMIENTTEARPQTGLDSAGIVFETVTEAGITRNLALYQEDMPEEVGPIRSLRPYLVDWVMGFDASIAHVGGSAEALQLVDQRDTKSLDQQNNPEPYYRDDDRAAPHNMYADMEGLRELQEELGHEKSQFDDIPRSDDNKAENPAAENITIDFSSADFEVEFQYEADNNTYTRYLAGEPHIDAATDQPITVKNVVVISIDTDGDTVEAIGSGDAFIFKDGNVQEVNWQKDSYNERIKLTDDEGNQVPFNRGDSWFAMLPNDKSVDY